MMNRILFCFDERARVKQHEGTYFGTADDD